MKKQLYVLVLLCSIILMTGCSLKTLDEKLSKANEGRAVEQKSLEERLKEEERIANELYEEKADSIAMAKILESNIVYDERNSYEPSIAVVFKDNYGKTSTAYVNNSYLIGNVTEIKGNYIVIKTFGDKQFKYIVEKSLIENKKQSII